MQLSGSSRWLLRLGTAVTLAFLYIPLFVILVYAFNSTRVQKWPPAACVMLVVEPSVPAAACG